MTRLDDRIRLRAVVRPDCIMLIGDRVNRWPGETHPPWCADRGCSSWLMKLLDQAKIPEDQLYWDNAYDEVGNKTDLERLVGIWKPRAIIAMGRAAQNVLTSQGYDPIYVIHPQSAMRFGRAMPYRLIEILMNLTKCDIPA